VIPEGAEFTVTCKRQRTPVIVEFLLCPGDRVLLSGP